jgi:GNAT superfamily N-acetyltransferase
VLAGRTVAATVAGRTVGFATTAAGGTGVELEALFVDPGWMGRGVGRRLVHHVVASARAARMSRIDVTAGDDALGFYVALGFTTVGTAATRFGPAHRMELVVEERAGGR